MIKGNDGHGYPLLNYRFIEVHPVKGCDGYNAGHWFIHTHY